jgi:hypothetical protein
MGWAPKRKAEFEGLADARARKNWQNAIRLNTASYYE